MERLPSYHYLHRVAAPPLVQIPMQHACGAQVWAKLEYMNPSGSTKDRIARHILEKALRRGDLKPGDWVVEASSGSTSIALALAAAQLGLKFLAFIPMVAAKEREMLIRGYGGECRRVEGGMMSVIEQACSYAENNGHFCARQFENTDNCEAHALWTASEVLHQLGGLQVDVVVSGVGTGGTLRGLWEGFTAMGCDTEAVAAIPTSPIYPNNPEGCSLCFSSQVPGVVEGCSKLYSEWKASGVVNSLQEFAVDDGACMERTQWLWRRGFPVGPSSGLNLEAAFAAARGRSTEDVVVTVFPDRMERYFSHPVFEKIAQEGLE